MRRKKILDEEDLHKIVMDYPEIFIGDNNIIDIQHEVWKSDRSRIDIIITTKRAKYILEIKNRKIKYEDILQLKRYLIDIKAREDFIAILIGREIKDNLRDFANKLGIKVLIIGKDVPEKLKVCGICKKAYSYNLNKCPKCNSANIQLIIEL
ncbi:MAG: hypothetical protein ACTSVW_01190 [Candidatus Njordarchaeales archaeon]